MSGVITLISGSSQTGKSSGTERAVKTARRCLIWDYQAQFSEIPTVVRVSDPRALHRIATTYKGPGRFAFVPRGDLAAAFNGFCRAAHYWGQYMGPCLVIADELSTVSTPSKAPPAWGDLVRMCAKYGVSITAITQRPAESDKTVIGNAHIIRAYRMARAKDRDYMATELGLNRDERARFDALPNYHYIERDTRTGRLKFGKNPTPQHIISR